MLSPGDDTPGDNQATSTEVGEFAGMPLGRETIFVIDRGSQTQPAFDAIRRAVIQSVRELPTGARFSVIFWANPLDPDSPEDGVIYTPGRVPRASNEATLRALEEDFESVVTGGATDVAPAMKIAASNDPDVIVLITGNAWALETEFADSVLGSLGQIDSDQWPVVHTVAAGNSSDGVGRPLATIANKTGGMFQGMTVNGLNDAAK